MRRFLAIVMLSLTAAITPTPPAPVGMPDDYEEGGEPASICQAYRTRRFRRFDAQASVPDILVV